MGERLLRSCSQREPLSSVDIGVRSRCITEHVSTSLCHLRLRRWHTDLVRHEGETRTYVVQIKARSISSAIFTTHFQIFDVMPHLISLATIISFFYVSSRFLHLTKIFYTLQVRQMDIDFIFRDVVTDSVSRRVVERNLSWRQRGDEWWI